MIITSGAGVTALQTCCANDLRGRSGRTPMTLRPDDADDSEATRRQVRLAVVSSVIGTSIEWYDYFLYGTAAAIVFPAVFFPASSSYSGTLDSFATYAVGFAARPVGAAIFGHWGDRLGGE